MRRTLLNSVLCGVAMVISCHAARGAALQGPRPTAVTTVLAPGAPMFLVTPARRAVWARERATNHWLYQLAVANCTRTGTPDEKYGEMGWSCAWVYQVTGAATAANKVIAKLEAYGTRPLDNNTVRATLAANVILADWIWRAFRSRAAAAKCSS